MQRAEEEKEKRGRMGEKYSRARQHSHIHGRRDLLSLVPPDTAQAIAKILLIHYAHRALARYH